MQTYRALVRSTRVEYHLLLFEARSHQEAQRIAANQDEWSRWRPGVDEGQRLPFRDYVERTRVLDLGPLFPESPVPPDD